MKSPKAAIYMKYLTFYRFLIITHISIFVNTFFKKISRFFHAWQILPIFTSYLIITTFSEYIKQCNQDFWFIFLLCPIIVLTFSITLTIITPISKFVNTFSKFFCEIFLLILPIITNSEKSTVKPYKRLFDLPMKLYLWAILSDCEPFWAIPDLSKNGNDKLSFPSYQDH